MILNSTKSKFRFRDPAQEFGDIDIRVSRISRLHDRFLQVDDVVWHSGHSFNQMGKGEISLMTLVAEPAEHARLWQIARSEASDDVTLTTGRLVGADLLRRALEAGLAQHLPAWDAALDRSARDDLADFSSRL